MLHAQHLQAEVRLEGVGSVSRLLSRVVRQRPR
jgi:hypothetical protein